MAFFVATLDPVSITFEHHCLNVQFTLPLESHNLKWTRKESNLSLCVSIPDFTHKVKSSLHHAYVQLTSKVKAILKCITKAFYVFDMPVVDLTGIEPVSKSIIHYKSLRRLQLFKLFHLCFSLVGVCTTSQRY